ncbi:FAD-dependent thymidylate synthase, partial [Nocardia mangyaensis]|uniref:FAD-dependent thymidylate synthase n=1 Tax=Nocardia mangyaensis TaxID=2213200 RepID=UPI002674D199
SYGKTKQILEEADKKLIKYLANHEHMTPFEHCVLTVRIKCPIYISKQIMRHRTFSFNEISRRYTEENIEFYTPETFRKQHEKSKQCSDGESGDELKYYCQDTYKTAMVQARAHYEGLIKAGVAREIARGVLPQALMTEFYMTGNLRNWEHFIDLRIDAHAQEEVQFIAQEVINIIEEKFPVAYYAL